MRGVTCERCKAKGLIVFQPALPMRGVTEPGSLGCFADAISTRTPHAGSDLDAGASKKDLAIFQPALPMRGVTTSFQ